MVNMDCSPSRTIFIYHLVGVGDPFYHEWAFHSGAILLVRSGGYGLIAAGAGGGSICWWVSESHCLNTSTYAAGSSRDGEAYTLLSKSGGKVGSLPVAIMEAEKPWGSWAMAFNASMMPGIWSTQVREGVHQASESGAYCLWSDGSAL